MSFSLYTLSNHIYTFTVLLLFLLTYTGFVVLFLPIYILRLVVSILKLVLRPDLDKMIVTRSSILAVDNPYKSPKWNLCVWLVLENPPDLESFIESFDAGIVQRKGATGKFMDPEFQQYYCKWLGFLFWKWDRNYKTTNHHRFYHPEEGTPESGERRVTEQDLKGIINELTWAPFKERQSPWEFVYIRNYLESGDDSPKFVVIFRVHHGFSDGLAILRLLLQQVCGVSLSSIAQPENFVKSPGRRMRDALLFPLLGPYQFSRMLAQAWDRNEWHQGGENLSPSWNFTFSQKIQLSLVKEVKNLHGVSFTAVVMSVIAGGMRRMMLKGSVPVPRNINAGVPIPMPGHPTKMRNHFIFSFLKLPIGIADPVLRLRKTERNVADLKSSHAPLMSFTLIPLVGGVFHWLMKPFNYNRFSTAIISNFPGPTEKGQFLAGGSLHTVTDMNFTGGAGEGDVGIGFTILSFGDSLRICSSVNGSLLPTESSVQELSDCIVEELHTLHKLATV